MRAVLRLLTAIAMIAVCGYLVTQGFKIVQFSLAVANIDTLEQRVKIINDWATASGVGSIALQAGLGATPAIDDSQRYEMLSAMLSIKPLSSTDWLSIARVRLGMGQPMTDVLRSLSLSVLTGPNEEFVMVDRGIFGVTLWDSLSPDLKWRVAVDLTTGERGAREKIHAILSAEPETVRNELRGAMLATGRSPKEVERRLGF